MLQLYNSDSQFFKVTSIFKVLAIFPVLYNCVLLAHFVLRKSLSPSLSRCSCFALPTGHCWFALYVLEAAAFCCVPSLL